MRSESPSVIQGNRVKKDSLTAEDVQDECFCSKAFFCLGTRGLLLPLNPHPEGDNHLSPAGGGKGVDICRGKSRRMPDLMFRHFKGMFVERRDSSPYTEKSQDVYSRRYKLIPLLLSGDIPRVSDE